MDVLRFILRLPFILLRLAARSLVYLFTLLGFLLRPFTGRIRWAVPGGTVAKLAMRQPFV
ncbi:TPA: hypothetical protein ROH85_005257, partial [Escherichia coli]|nr:hypothetical protein [Escherichia coli]